LLDSLCGLKQDPAVLVPVEQRRRLARHAHEVGAVGVRLRDVDDGAGPLLLRSENLWTRSVYNKCELYNMKG